MLLTGGDPASPRTEVRGVSHSFVIPAYGHSPYLAACLDSLAAQVHPSEIVVATSTPFDGIDVLCAKYGARLVEHGPNRGIGNDWNQAVAAATTRLVTIAHQDDLYDRQFSKEVVATYNRFPDAYFFFTDTGEVTHTGETRPGGMNLRVKRLLARSAFLGRRRISGPFSRRLLLGFGNSIVCPSVTLNLGVAKGFRFREDLRTNMDWLAWLELSERGPVAYVPQQLMSHRVHGQSETARCLDDGTRKAEDHLVLARLWPGPLAAFIGRLYSHSYRDYV